MSDVFYVIDGDSNAFWGGSFKDAEEHAKEAAKRGPGTEIKIVKAIAVVRAAVGPIETTLL